MKPRSASLHPDDILIHMNASGGTRELIIDRRKDDDDGWWMRDGSGLGDHVFDTQQAWQVWGTNEQVTLGESREIVYGTSPLSVHVDVNQLLHDYDEATTWEILGKLKDFFAEPTKEGLQP